MGLSFRKSKKIGPFRVSVSKSGVSYSAGVKGFRVTKKANGDVQTTTSIPGTGIRSTKTYKAGQKTPAKKTSSKTSLWGMALVLALVVVACGTSGGGGESSTPPAVSDGSSSSVEQVDVSASSQLPEDVEVPDASTQQPDASDPAPDEPDPQPDPEPVTTPDPEPEPEPEPTPDPEPVVTPEPEPEPDPAPVVTTPVETTPDPEPEQTTTVSASYIGNKNSYVFHKSTCSSVDKMKDKNKVPLSSRDEAISRGFDPCERCNP